MSQVAQAEEKPSSASSHSDCSSQRNGTIAAEEETWSASKSNPQNWPEARRWIIVLALAVTNFVAAMTTAFEPALGLILDDFHVTNEKIGSLSISIYVLGYFIGPPVIAPISEVYGRLWLLRAAYVLFLICLIVCGLSNSIGLFIAFRALMGFAAIVFVLLGPAIVPDIVDMRQRGLAMSLMLTGVTFGPTLGPVMGGFVAQRASWRWIFGACAIAFAVSGIAALAVLQETYAPVLKARYEAQRNKTVQEPDYNSHQDPPQTEVPDLKAKLRRSWLLPFRILIRSPVVVIVAIHSTIANAYLLLLLSTLGTVFEADYHFSPEASGLCYLGMMVGFLIAQMSLGYVSDAFIKRKTLQTKASWQHQSSQQEGDEQDVKPKPEWRLPPLVAGSLIMPGGLIWYGWTAQLHTHWILPVIGSGVFTLGFMYTYLPLSLYLIDMYSTYAASATAGCVIIRAISSALLPLAADPLFDRLGYGWGNSLLAFIAVLFFPVPVLLWRYGERIRQRCHLEEKDILL